MFAYDIIIWSSHLQYSVDKINSPENRFCKCLRIKFSGSLNGLCLSNRRVQADVTFILKLVNEILDCSKPLEQLNFAILSANLRSQPMFSIMFQQTNYSKGAQLEV